MNQIANNNRSESVSLCNLTQLKRGGSEVTLLQFQKVREGSVESYSRLRGLSSNHPCSDYKISMKGSQLLKFAAQVTHGMVRFA